MNRAGTRVLKSAILAIEGLRRWGGPLLTHGGRAPLNHDQEGKVSDKPKPDLEKILRDLLERLTIAIRPIDVAVAAGIALQEIEGFEEPK